jgi:hypothetical protein
MKAVVWRCHGLFASKSSAAAQEGNPGARALLKKSSVEGKGLDETTVACLSITKGRMGETPKRASLHSIVKDRPFELDGFHPAPGLLGSKNPSDQSAAPPVAPHGLLDRNPCSDKARNAAYVPFVLQFLGKGRKRRIDHRGSNCSPDPSDAFSEAIKSIKKGAARILH